MSRVIRDLTGQRFGKLLAIAQAGRGNAGGVRWLCLCDCGQQKIVQSTHLITGDTMSCGCLGQPTRIKNLAGKRFGKLQVISQAGRDPQGRMLWLCLCDCGAGKVIPSRHLRSGAIVSCGCYVRSIAAANGKAGAVKHSGSRSPLYKPELTDEERLGRRNLPELRAWRTAVFIRDNFTCDLCGERGGRLVAHHLDCWASYPDSRFELANGITLCHQHHRDFHTSLGGERKPCTRTDYESFKARWYLDREITRLDRDEP